ncbi:MAG: tRNA (adenosine(37)-N6)-dimethylallyltransferase MiaA [Bacillota bacterium]|nr:tRNA (adenosine(37)-N6)-dimethylallyltransferase MiaA [Bacillota bacterium]
MCILQVIVVTGPTASGKSDTAILLAEQLDGEIVSADSMQVYRGMDIGTAKVDETMRRRIRHHLIDICDPGEPFSVAAYQLLAEKAIKDILARGKRPIVCGGTGQYLSALIDGLTFAPAPADPMLRRELEKKADQLGLPDLWLELEQLDPDSASRISPNDRKRIIRALEIYSLTGQPMSWHDARSRIRQPVFAYQTFCLTHDRPVLYERINNRVLQMMQKGLLDEVHLLLDKGVPVGSTSLQAIGYKELIAYLQGDCLLEQAVAKIQQASRNYAKRQLTWFRKMNSVCWLENENPEDACRKIRENLRNFASNQ